MSESTAAQLGSGLVFLSLLSVPVYAATILVFPEHLVPIGVMYLVFASGLLLASLGGLDD